MLFSHQSVKFIDQHYKNFIWGFLLQFLLIEMIVKLNCSSCWINFYTFDILPKYCVYIMRIWKLHSIDSNDLDFNFVIFLILFEVSEDFLSCCCLSSSRHSRDIEWRGRSFWLDSCFNEILNFSFFFVSTWKFFMLLCQ